MQGIFSVSKSTRERAGIGRQNGLKIRRAVRFMRVQVPPLLPINTNHHGTHWIKTCNKVSQSRGSLPSCITTWLYRSYWVDKRRRSWLLCRKSRGEREALSHIWWSESYHSAHNSFLITYINSIQCLKGNSLTIDSSLAIESWRSQTWLSSVGLLVQSKESCRK